MYEPIASSVSETVRQILHNLKLDQPDFFCLITFEEVYSLVQTDLEEQQLPRIKPEHLAFRVISQHLYLRCKDTNEELHNAAYQWLGQHLYRYIWFKVDKNLLLAQELVNDSLLTIYSELSQNKLRSPTAFLAWTRRIAHCSIATYYRKQSKTEIKIQPTQANTISNVLPKLPYEITTKVVTQVEKADDEDDDDADTAIARVQRLLNYVQSEKDLVDEAANPEKIVLGQEKRRLLLEGILNMKTTTKRARDYQYILIATYFFDWTDDKIAQQLGLELKEVYKRRFQALKLLRRDKAWFDDLRYD